MTKAEKVERAEAIDKLRGWIKPGDTVYTILDHVSTSGMSRAIRVLVPTVGENGHAGTVDFIHPNYAVGKALGLRHWKRQGREQDALVVGGCGMDMGFHLVYELSHTLYGGRVCGCGAWWHEGQAFTQAEYEAREGRGRLSDGWTFRHNPGCPKCGGSGYLLTSGYQCLGKGKCPSNYHVNHRDQLRCAGTIRHNPDGPDFGARCWRPDGFFSRREVPENWPRSAPINVGEGQTIPGHLLSCLMTDSEEPGEVCPTCKGAGYVPNPEGPERWDLRHTDGYAIRQRWL